MREEHRCAAMRKSTTGRRRGNGVYEYGVFTMAAVVVFHLCLDVTSAAPAAYDSLLPQSGEIAEYFSNNEYISGCYYNFQRYEEGDRIVTNEPCLNCTCHNRMLMCYLRVCPFTKAIGQDCTIEKKPDQCCPIITCPEVPVKLLTSSTTSSPTPTTQTTEVGFHDNYGCSIDDSFYADGAQVPSDPRKPCELCYCIRNRTACVMQECTLHVEGCKPVYQDGICCPVRYDCDYEKEIMSTPRLQTSGGVIKSTTYASVIDCQYGNQSYSDGELITTDKPCEHCYCMRGDIVCAVQDCGEPLRGKDCVPTMPPPEKCCPSSYDCTNDTSSTTESVTKDPNTFNTEAPTTFGKSTPYAIHTSSVLTPDEIYTKLGENKSPQATNSSIPAHTSNSHPSEGIQMDSNGADVGEHFPATVTSQPTTFSSHQSTSRTASPVERLTTIGEIQTTSFEQHPHGERQTTIIVGDIPTTVLPDFSSIATNEGSKITSTQGKPAESYPPSTTFNDDSATTNGYSKLTETTKYYSNEVSEPQTERVTSSPEGPLDHPISNEIADNGQSPNKPTQNEPTQPQNTIIKVPSDSGLAVTTEVPEYSTNLINKIDTTSHNAVTETKNTIADKNTEPVNDGGVEQPTQNTIQGSSDGVDENSVAHTESPASGSAFEEPTTHYVDFSSIGTKEPFSSTISSQPTSFNYSTESLSGFSSHSPDHFSEDNSNSQPIAQTTASPEVVSQDQSYQTTISNLISDSTNSPTTPSAGLSEADQVSTQQPQVILNNPADRVDTPESQTNHINPISDGANAPLETTTNHIALEAQDLPSSSQVKDPVQEVGSGTDNSIPYTKQPIAETTHSETPSVDETTVTYSSPANASPANASPVNSSPTFTEVNESSTSSPSSTLDGSATIPGEGSCLVDGITYPNASIIESSNPCHSKCVCLSSIPTCTLISCSPPPSDPKCMPVQIKPESCCPVYVCHGDETPAAASPIPSHNHISENDLETNSPPKLSDVPITTEQAVSQSESTENSLDTREKPSILSSSSPESPSTLSTTPTPEPVLSNDSHEIQAPGSHDDSHDSSHDSSHDNSHDDSHNTSHDENEISNDVYSGTEVPAIPPASDSQTKNASHATPLSSNVGSAIRPVDSSTNKVDIHDEPTYTTTESVNENESYTTTDASSLSSQEYTQSATQGQSSTEYQSEVTIPKEVSENNEIATSPELEKESVTTSEAAPSPSELPDISVASSQPVADTTIHSSSVPEEASTSTSSSVSDESEIKTTTSEPVQNIPGETTPLYTESSHDIYSSSSESTTALVDDSDSLITAPPEQEIVSSSSEQPEVSPGVYQTTVRPHSEYLPAETTISSLPDHSEDTGLTTSVNDYSTDVPSEEPSTASPVDNKFQEKLSTSAPSSETEVYQSVPTSSVIPASASSELSSERPAESIETTVYADEEITTKQPIGEHSSYSTSTSQSDVATSTYDSIHSPSQAAITEHEVTEINTQPASVAASSEITPSPESVDTKITLAPVLSNGSADSITTTAGPVSEASPVQSGEHQSALPAAVTTTSEEDAPTTISASQSNFWSDVPQKVATLLNQTTSTPPSSTSVTYPPIQHSTWTRKPIDEESTSEPNYYPQPPMYPPGIENGNVDGPPVEEYDEENGAFGPGTCRYAGKVYVSAQQIPRDDPCDFCFCFRSDIICLQQSCPPPIHGCRQEPIEGFCCPRYECPVNTYGLHNISTSTTTTTTTSSSRPPRSPAARRNGCLIHGHFYDVGQSIPIASGPCLECLCGADSRMKCDPRICSPEPHLRQEFTDSK